MNEELLKKIRDPKTYLENFTKIKGKIPGRLIPFILKEHQKDLFNAVERNNRVIILKARQMGFCFYPKTKVLKADLSWVEIDSLRVGDKIVATDEKVLGGSGSSRKMTTAVIQNKWNVNEEALKLTMSDGRVLILTLEHRMLCRARGAAHTQWRKARDIKLDDEIRFITKVWKNNPNYEDGWISRIIDREGCLRTKKNAGVELNISQVDGFVWDRIVKYFGDNNYLYRIEVDKRVAGSSSKLGTKPVNKLVVSRMDEIFRLLGTVRPSRFCKKFWWEGKKFPRNGWSKVVKIELLPKQRMIDLQTSAKTYIANGFVSHNSAAMVGWMYHSTIMNPGTTTAIIGYNSDLTAELLDKVKTFLNSTPEELRPTTHYNSKYEVSFPKINSKILVLPSTVNVGRGYTLNLVLATELSSWEDAEEKMMTLEASVPINGKIVIESCVTGDTIVFTNNGLKFVEDIHSWDNSRLGFSEGKEIKLDGHYGLKSTNTYYNSGIRKGFRVVTKHGYEVGMSSVHKMFVLDKDELKFIGSKNLKIGDKLAVKYGQELWGNNDRVDWKPTKYGFNKKWIRQFNPEEITKDLAYLIGLILGDGSIYKNDELRSRSVTVTTVDRDVSNFLLNNNLGLKFYKGKRENYYHYRCTNKSFVEFLQNYIGFENGARARNKKIPKVVLGWSRNNVVAFLQGLFDADGCCRKDRGNVSFVSTSKNIIDVLRVLLLNFGIISRTYSYNHKPTKKVKVWSSGYQLELTQSHTKIFLEKIGFRIRRKQINGKERKGCYDCLQEFIPGIGKVIKGHMKEMGLKYSDVAHGLNCGLFSKSGNITYNVLNRILKKCRNKECEEYNKLKELCDKKYLYDEVVKIVPIEENVYDFTVEDGHTVTYGGFVGHQTPKGTGNLYHQMWMSEDNGYVKKKYGWWWDYSSEEVNLIKKRMNNPTMFSQEYELSFLSSGRSVFDANVIEEQRKNILKVGDEIIDDGKKCKVHIENDLRIYKEPKEGEYFVCGADISEGIEGGDYSVMTIWNRKTGEEVAMWRGLIPPDVFGERLNKWGRKYNNALMVVEINNHGLTTLTILKQKVYPSLYYRLNKLEGPGISTGDKLGWKTTKVTRPLLIDEYAQACRDEELIIHSKEILDEMSVFIYDDNGNMTCPRSFKDDCIFAAAIAFQGFKVMFSEKPTQISWQEHLPNNFAY